jgi:hypothetical protein
MKGTTTPLSGFSFSANATTQAGWTALSQNLVWAGFLSPISTMVAPGLAVDLLISLNVPSGTTNSQLLSVIALASLGTDEANSDGSLKGGTHLTLRPLGGSPPCGGGGGGGWGLGSPVTNTGANWSGAQCHILDVQALGTTGAGYTANGMLGVERAPNGHFYVSGRRNTTNTALPNNLFDFDAAGNFVAVVAQPGLASSAGAAWGIRDLAWDGGTGATSRIYGGLENATTANKVYAFDWNTGAFDAASDITLAAPVNNTVRALGYDSGNNVFAATNWSGAIEYFDKTGAVAKPTTANPSTFTYGLAYDAQKKTYWAHGQGGSTRTATTTQVVFVEFDANTGAASGQQFIGDLSIPGTAPGGIAGGLGFYTTASNQPAMVYLTQATSDAIVTVHGRFEYATGCAGAGDISFFSEAYAGNANWALTVGGIPGGVASAFPCYGAPSPAGIPILPALLCGPLNLNLAIFFDCGPAQPVAGGGAQFNLPIPATAAGAQLAFQWIYIGGLPNPVKLTEAGMIWVAM